ncbi:uncharacterized protein VTP21DRAFT_10468 [Calcarisporiella thermophila]|uniref:uncharacterized protein n=1 Tax=Calcarisporiella thermophila TaxID=911321 RepID=UPI003742AC4E
MALRNMLTNSPEQMHVSFWNSSEYKEDESMEMDFSETPIRKPHTLQQFHIHHQQHVPKSVRTPPTFRRSLSLMTPEEMSPGGGNDLMVMTPDPSLRRKRHSVWTPADKIAEERENNSSISGVIGATPFSLHTLAPEATPPCRTEYHAPPLRGGATAAKFVTTQDENISPASMRILEAMSLKCGGIGAGEWALMRERGKLDNPFL